MPERRTRGGYESGTMSASELLNLPDSFKRPATVAPEPQDAAPRVPTHACPKCGEPDTSLRWCNGEYTLNWGSCGDRTREHFHRGCSRCKHRWTTYDVLDGQ